MVSINLDHVNIFNHLYRMTNRSLHTAFQKHVLPTFPDTGSCNNHASVRFGLQAAQEGRTTRIILLHSLMSLPRFSPFHVLFLNLMLIFPASINLYCFVLFLFLTMLFIKFTSFKYTAWWILVIVYNHSHHDNQNTERFLPCFYYTCSPPSVIPLAFSNHWL